MIDWATLEFDRLWPAGLAAVTAMALLAAWYWPRRAVFADADLLVRTRRWRGLADISMPLAGMLLLVTLALVMMGPSVVRKDLVEQQSRDFVILVDTSRSMRHDTAVRRESMDLHYQRRVGAFLADVADPDSIPYVARFELARESLFRFLNAREADDRVALLYFNDDVHPVSALSSDIGFLIDQLGTMDTYVNWGTDMAAAMNSGFNMLERYPGDNRRSIILLTDAETRNSDDLEDQFARLGSAPLSFYMLWITTDSPDLASEDAQTFLDLAASVGTVYTINDPDEDSLREALADIGRNEAYRYEELRHVPVDLAAPLRALSRILLLLWLLAAATLWRPVFRRRVFADHVEQSS